jgi:hypothetical protein
LIWDQFEQPYRKERDDSGRLRRMLRTGREPAR